MTYDYNKYGWCIEDQSSDPRQHRFAIDNWYCAGSEIGFMKGEKIGAWYSYPVFDQLVKLHGGKITGDYVEFDTEDQSIWYSLDACIVKYKEDKNV